ncbi:hypothetical protein [Oceanicola sp. S124]|uniref:hypothetical protein n=1 Tax=Oceanicola sp. S124 TaxID=1042378 RepID=UPI0002558217|nr:hypothetical protein [Oceanicola sp. S124]
MVFVNVQEVKADELQRYDRMMIECSLKIEEPENIAPLAINIWIEVLKELSVRGKVELVSGSFDAPFDALINRL